MDEARKKIILVDDIKSNLDQGRKILDPFYQVYPATSAETLFKYLNKFIPDLILLDIEMPVMNGYETLKKIKENERYIDIPVIFLTAKNDERSEREGFELGAADYMSKPFSAPLLLKRIENQLVLSEQKNQLKTALRNAEQASEAKSSFLANTSHEMRTPLNAVIGLAELSLESEGLNEETRSNLEKIYNAGANLLSIVNDILDISKIEAGEFELVDTEYDVPSLINDTVMQNILRIGEKPIELKLDIGEDLFARLYGDELRLKQIISNLLSNAIKYTQEGSVELSISCAREGGGSGGAGVGVSGDDGGGVGIGESVGEGDTVWLTIRVKDTGKGIRPEDIDKLFSSYTQVDAKANRNIEGIGLGLSITKRLSEMMRGTISVESEYGRGSTFTVMVAQKFVSNVRIGPAIMENLKYCRYSDAKRDRQVRFKRINMPYARVLVVDDNATNLTVAKGLMKPYGMQIDCVTNGQDAINIIKSEGFISETVKYNAIFMDHMMPEMDGIEATRLIRGIGTDYAKNIPIIALSANALVGNEEMFTSKGFQAFLSKPIDIAKMDLVLRQWVRDKSKEAIEYAGSASDVSNMPTKPDMSTMPDMPTMPSIPSMPTIPDMPAGQGQPAGSVESPAGPVEQPESSWELPEISGLDIHKGLRMYDGDTDIYLPILRAYAQNTQEVIERLKNVTMQNLPEYAIDVHGLKGASASIGAENIRVRALELEMKSKAGDLRGVLDLNNAFLLDVGTLVECIIAWFLAQDSKHKKPVLHAPDPSVLIKLHDCLIAFDSNGADEIIAELEKFDYETNADLIPWLKHCILESNFDEAAEKIAKMLTQGDGSKPLKNAENP